MANEIQLSQNEREIISRIFNRPSIDMEPVLKLDDATKPTYPTKLALLKLKSVAFRDRRDIRKALSQFYGVLHAMNRRFLFIMESCDGLVNLYMGLDNSDQEERGSMSSQELTHSLLGVLPGCQVESLSSTDDIIQRVANAQYSYLVTGVPTCQLSWEKRDQHQEEEKARTGIERIVDSLSGEDFVLSIICEPLTSDELREYRTNVGNAYDMVKPWGRFHVNQSKSQGHGSSEGENESETDGTSFSKTEQKSETKQGDTRTQIEKEGAFISEETRKKIEETYHQRNNILKSPKKVLQGIWHNSGNASGSPSQESRLGRMWSTFWNGGKVAEFSQTIQLNPTVSVGTSETDGKTHSRTTGHTSTISHNETETIGLNREMVSMELSAVADELARLHKRLLQAGGEGMWKTCIMFHAKKESTLRRAAYAGSAIWSGDDSAIDPIRCIKLPNISERKRSQIDLLQLRFCVQLDGEEESLPMHPLGNAYSNLYTCLTHKELAHIADFPHWELPGISVLPLVEYARTSPRSKEGEAVVELGGMIDRTVNRADDTLDMVQKVRLGYDQLNKHCFVSGITGSGKSTTMRSLLRQMAQHEEKPIPFMVIEPVKTDYRALAKAVTNKQGDVIKEPVGMHIFSPGRRRIGQEVFSLNPFSFPAEVGLFSHLDFLKSAFNALLGAYSSMPFLLEELLCQAYAKRGWDLSTGEHEELNREISAVKDINPEALWKLRENKMPLISDLPDMVDEVLADCFGEDKSDYRISLRGALKARLKSLCNSLKGEFLARHDTHDFAALLKENVLFELEAFSDNDEKSFIMALLLGRLYEYRQAEYYQRGEITGNSLRHIVVLEEAHRLLAKTEGKGELQASPRAKAVETFSDMLAEIRSYGQGMIIVDQIPSKLTPEVMKNTEVKIVHRLLSKDDREAVGATMNLDKEQIDDLARHAPGEATMYFGNMTNAMHVKINEY